MPDREKYIEVLSKAAKTVKEFSEDTPIKINLKCVEDILELLKEQKIVMCKDCEYRERLDKCFLARCAATRGDPVFMLDNHGNWFCGDGVKKTETDKTERKPTMTLLEYQSKAMRTSSTKLTRDEHLMNGCLGLAGEAGECCDLLKKSQFQDGREIREKLLDELGDVLWYVAETASAIGYTLDDVAEHNIKKLMDRYPEGFDPERSLHRKE